MKSEFLSRFTLTMAICHFLHVGYSQNMGIGVSDPIRARLEVNGVAGTGTTSAIFGGDVGISFLRSYAGIGFNLYRDSSRIGYRGRYMGGGYAALIGHSYSDLGNASGYYSLSIFPSGGTGSLIPVGKSVMNITGYSVLLNTERLSTERPACLMVGRGTGIDGTAAFSGTTFTSFFNFRPTEHTYIRGGKSVSKVFVNDLNKGKIIIGADNGTSRLGVNAPDPQYPFEIRQVNGTGVRMIVNRQGIEYSWEWRVGASPNFLMALYNGSARASFSNVDGSHFALSDKRVKRDIKDLPDQIEKIVQLSPIMFDAKEENPNNVKSSGFNAEEVQALFPQLVKVLEDKDKLSVCYSGFHVLAIKGIQEEQRKILIAEKRAQLLEEKIKALEASVR